METHPWNKLRRRDNTADTPFLDNLRKFLPSFGQFPSDASQASQPVSVGIISSNFPGKYPRGEMFGCLCKCPRDGHGLGNLGSSMGWVMVGESV